MIICILRTEKNAINIVYKTWFFWGGLCPTWEFFTPMETSPSLVKGGKFWPILGIDMAIEQWGFCSVPHLLWHGVSVYNGHLPGPWQLHHCWPFSSGAVTTCFYDGGQLWLGFKHPTFCMQGNWEIAFARRQSLSISIFHQLVMILIWQP